MVAIGDINGVMLDSAMPVSLNSRRYNRTVSDVYVFLHRDTLSDYLLPALLKIQVTTNKIKAGLSSRLLTPCA